MTSKTMSPSEQEANVEEIWRRHGWVPPSLEDPVVIQRQAQSRGEVYEMPRVRGKDGDDSNKELP